MVYDSLLLYAVVKEMRSALVGARVSRVFMPAEGTAVLEFSARAALPQILLCWQPGHARVHLAAHQTPRPGLNSAFVDVLRRFLRGARLEDVVQIGFDRVLRLEFSNAENLGPLARCCVVAEPIGRWANAVLIDDQGEIREAARHVAAAVNRRRELLAGVPYRPPPGAELPPLAGVTAEKLTDVAASCDEVPLQDLVRYGFQGAGPVLLAELWARTETNPQCAVGQQPEGWAQELAEAMAELLEESEAGRAWLYRSPDSALLVYPVRLHSREGNPPQQADSLSAALERLAADEFAKERVRQLRQRVVAAAERGRQRVGRRRQAREETLQAAREAQRWREYGEALLANLWRIPPGVAEVEIPSYAAEGERLLRVPLNPNYSAQDNAQRYFARYKKAQRTGRALPELIAADAREEEFLAEVVDEAERGEEADLVELESELVRRGHVKCDKRRQPTGEGRSRLPQLVDERGWTLWYGRTGMQNDRLLREAAPEDWWLHVRDGTGGHVLVRTGGRPERVPEQTLHLAARLAAGLSRQRESSRVEVVRTLAKHVRKVKGRPPGFVLYDHEATEAVSPLVPQAGGPDSACGAISRGDGKEWCRAVSDALRRSSSVQEDP